MDPTGRSIMYVGIQFVPSVDRPNARPDRVWNGPGDVVNGVPPIQAHALCQHKDEWLDVTEFASDPAKLTAKAQAVRAESEDKLRRLRNPPDAPNNKRTVDAFSDEELELEMERRRAARGVIDQAPAASQPTKQAGGKGKPKGEAKLNTAIQGAVERVSAKVANGADESLLDESGIPTLAAVNEELGYQIGEDEYKHALNDIQN